MPIRECEIATWFYEKVISVEVGGGEPARSVSAYRCYTFRRERIAKSDDEVAHPDYVASYPWQDVVEIRINRMNFLIAVDLQTVRHEQIEQRWWRPRRVKSLKPVIKVYQR